MHIQKSTNKTTSPIFSKGPEETSAKGQTKVRLPRLVKLKCKLQNLQSKTLEDHVLDALIEAKNQARSQSTRNLNEKVESRIKTQNLPKKPKLNVLRSVLSQIRHGRKSQKNVDIKEIDRLIEWFENEVPEIPSSRRA